MLKNSFFSAVFICGLTFLTACNSCNQPNSTTPKGDDKPTVTVKAPAFNADSAYAYTQAQVGFGPRNMNSKGHEACAAWLIAKMKGIADTVHVQKFEKTMFDGVTIHGTNIIASFNPEAKTRVLLCSHWDSRPWADQDIEERDKPILAANDGASGVGMLIAAANAIKSQPTEIGVDIFLIDAEDYGYTSTLVGLVKVVGDPENSFCQGSQYWAASPHIAGYKADFGILLDMAGAREAVFTREGNSSFNAGWVQDKVWANAQMLGFSNFSNQQTPPITDDHHYINTIAHIPTVDIIQYDNNTSSGFGKYWHTHADNMNIIDRNTLNAVGSTVLYTVYQYDAEQKAAIQ